jgi:hypothetical protein
MHKILLDFNDFLKAICNKKIIVDLYLPAGIKILAKGYEMRPILFLLNPGFTDGGRGPYFCPDTAYVEGYLNYVPDLAGKIDIRRVPFEKPRSEIIELLGAPNQGCPVYIFPEGEEAPSDAEMSPLTGRMYISDSHHIVSFLSRRFQTIKPHS